MSGGKSQAEERHLLRLFFHSPDLKFTLFSGPDCDLSPLCEQL